MCWRREGRSAFHPENEPGLTIRDAGCLKVKSKLASPGHLVRSPRSGTWSKHAAGPPKLVCHGNRSQQCPSTSVPSTEMKCAQGVQAGKALAHNATN